MQSKEMFFEKFREAAASVLPITLIVAVMCFFFVPVTADLLLAFLVGSVLLVVGMGLFTLGSDVSMSQIGSHMGAKLTKSRNLKLIMIVSLLLGIAITVAEPDLQALVAMMPLYTMHKAKETKLRTTPAAAPEPMQMACVDYGEDCHHTFLHQAILLIRRCQECSRMPTCMTARRSGGIPAFIASRRDRIRAVTPCRCAGYAVKEKG